MSATSDVASSSKLDDDSRKIAEERPPIVTIVTPSFNQGEFLEDTIQSVLSQTGNFYIEYVIMDGGSADNSVDIIKKYEALLQSHCDVTFFDEIPYYVRREQGFPYNRCRGIHYRWQSRPDGGQVRALNTAFATARGEISAWLNSDDFYVSALAVAAATKELCGDPSLEIVTGDGIITDRDGRKVWEHHVARVSPIELLYLDYHLLQPSTFFRTTLVRNAPFKEEFNFTFDSEFFTRTLLRGAKLKKIDVLMSGFRMYGDNITDKEHRGILLQKLKIAHANRDSLERFALGASYLSLAYYLNKRLSGRKFYAGYYRALFLPFQDLVYLAILGERYNQRFGNK